MIESLIAIVKKIDDKIVIYVLYETLDKEKERTDILELSS